MEIKFLAPHVGMFTEDNLTHTGEDEQTRWTLRWYNKEGDIQPCGAVSLRHGDVSIHNGGDRVIDVRVAGSATGGFQMVCDDAAARDGWWRALAACVAATRALARKRTIVSGYVVKDLDDGATLTEQFADAATTTVAGRVEINQCVGYEPASPRRRAGAASMAWRTTR